MSEYFTVVFEGDITKLGFNPLKTETIYGRPVAAGIGNSFARLEYIEEMEEAARQLVAVSLKYHES